MYLFLDTNFSVAVVMYKDNISTSFSINSFPLKICILCLIHYSLRGRRFGKKKSFPCVHCPPPPPLATHLSQTSGTSLEQSIEIPVLIGAVTDPGEGPGAPLIFRPTCGPRAERKFLRLPPFISGSG